MDEEAKNNRELFSFYGNPRPGKSRLFFCKKISQTPKASHEDGKLTKGEAKQALEAAKMEFLPYISAGSFDVIKASLGPVEDWVEGLIEAKVAEQKRGVALKVEQLANPLFSRSAGLENKGNGLGTTNRYCDNCKEVAEMFFRCPAKVKLFITIALGVCLATLVSYAALAYSYDLVLYGQDTEHTFLGVCTTNKYYPDSILNPYGNYGSKYSSTSIWNEFSIFGSPYSMYSAFNQYASKPPILILGDKIKLNAKNKACNFKALRFF